MPTPRRYSEADLAEIERELGRPLPRAYRRVLLTHGSGEIRPSLEVHAPGEIQERYADHFERDELFEVYWPIGCNNDSQELYMLRVGTDEIATIFHEVHPDDYADETWVPSTKWVRDVFGGDDTAASAAQSQEPDMKQILDCARSMADAMRLELAPDQETQQFLEAIVLTPQAEGGKAVWACCVDGLITEIETRNVLMANLATWIARTNHVDEPSAELWTSVELEEAFERALFGRLAIVDPGTDDSYWPHRVAEAWRALPEDIRHPPATEDALTQFEAEHGPIPEEFRWFLLECGGGVVGSEWIGGIEQLGATHRKFAEESAIEGGWTMRNVFVIGWDGAGNPIAIELEPAERQLFAGRVVVEDHQFGGVHVLAPSFVAFVARALGVRP